MHQPVLLANDTHGSHSHAHSSNHSNTDNGSYPSYPHTGSSPQTQVGKAYGEYASYSGSTYSSSKKWRKNRDYSHLNSGSDGVFGLVMISGIGVLAVVYIIAKLVEMIVKKREEENNPI